MSYSLQDFAKDAHDILSREPGPSGREKVAGKLSQLVKDGVEMGWPGWYDPGKPGSRDLALTAFGQHASLMSVSGTPLSVDESTVHLPVPFWPAVSRMRSMSGFFVSGST